MELIDKAAIVSDAWTRLGDDPRWQPYMQYFDLAMPFSFGVTMGYILELSIEGESLIENAYEALCEIARVDKNVEYASLDDMWANANWSVDA